MNDIERIKKYNEEKIANEKKQAVKHHLLFKIALENIKYKNNRQQKNLENLASKLSAAKTYEEKKNIYHKITKALSQLDSNNLTSKQTMSIIRDTIEKRFSINHIDADYLELSNYAMKIYENPIEVAKNESYLNISCYQIIESYQKEIEETKKIKITSEETEKVIPEYSQYDYSHSSIKTETTSFPTVAPEVKVSQTSQIDAIEDIMKIIENNTQGQTYQDGLTYKQREALTNAFGQEFYYFSTGAINDAVRMNQIKERISNQKIFYKDSQFKTSRTIEDLINLAIDCYEVQTFELLNPKGLGKDIDTQLNFKKLMNKLNAKNALVIYKKAYEKFINTYKILNQSEKEQLENIIKQTINPKYKEIFSIQDSYERIITPEELKEAINKKISEEILNWQMIDIHNYSSYYSNLKYATRLMSTDEIVKLYKNIQKQYLEFSNRPRIKDNENLIAEYKKSLEELQVCFCEVIKDKIGYQTAEITAGISEEEKERIIKKIELDNATVCLDYLEEKPLFLSPDTNIYEIKKGEAKKRGELKTATDAAYQRFYGMNKLQQTLAKATGAYAKLQQLEQKLGNVTEKDISEARHLF